MQVKILVTVRREELLPYALLVFKSLRVGFPTAEVMVYLNKMDPDHAQSVISECSKVNAQWTVTDTIHHTWIYEVLQGATEPFWLVDTDLIFYRNFEQYTFDAPMAGLRVPEFVDEFSGCTTRARLHTSLLYLDPMRIQTELIRYTSKIYSSPFTPQINLVNPVVLPFRSRPYYYDTAALLYHAVGGRAFTDIQKGGFCHFQFGTISDLVLPRLGRASEPMKLAREAILKDPSLGHDAWRYQEEWYAQRQP